MENDRVAGLRTILTRQSAQLAFNTKTSVLKQRMPGEILVMGEGLFGQLGLPMDCAGKAQPTSVPKVVDILDVAAGDMHTVCLTAEHKVITFGCNTEGALGRSTNEEGSEAIPGTVDIPRKVVQISAGESHTAALVEDGSLYVFGTFRKPYTEKWPVLLVSDVKFVRVASGAHHLVLLGTDGNVYTAGCGEQGQLGRVSVRASSKHCRRGPGKPLIPAGICTSRKFMGKFVDIWAGPYNSFAKDTYGNIHAWGLNDYNQLGIDDPATELYFPTVSKNFSGQNWVKISGGEHHTLCLNYEGDVYVLGRKEFGRLGLGDRCDDARFPTFVPSPGIKFIDVSCGRFTSFALTADGQLFSWGMGSTMRGVSNKEDTYRPTLFQAKQLRNRTIHQIEAGSHHLILLTHANGRTKPEPRQYHNKNYLAKLKRKLTQSD